MATPAVLGYHSAAAVHGLRRASVCLRSPPLALPSPVSHLRLSASPGSLLPGSRSLRLAPVSSISSPVLYHPSVPSTAPVAPFREPLPGDLGKSCTFSRDMVSLRRSRPCVGIQDAGHSSMELGENLPVAKMCGITSAKDAESAAMAGASLIGMILWPKSKRSISTNAAKEISKVARDYGAEPVGVFVDDDVDTMLRAYDVLDLEFVQLHGDESRAAFPLIMNHARVIYVLHADQNGNLLNHIKDEESALVDWLLVDSATGGSGKGFDWHKFRKPRMTSKLGWLLAGGLNPENVSEAIATLKPDGVDVSSGICGEDGIEKDRRKITSFMKNLRSL